MSEEAKPAAADSSSAAPSVAADQGEGQQQVVNLSTWRWRSPYVQSAFCSCVCGGTAGLYVALTGLGAGGGKPSSQIVASETNAIEDGIWAISSVFSGAILNRFGPAVTLAVGAAGFPLYVAGFWIYDSTGKAWVPPFLGALSGITAGALWAVQNWIATFYPEENEKGFYIYTNWTLIKSGAVIGSLIALGINYNRTTSSVPWYLYLIFTIIMCVATVAAFFTADTKTLRRNDGTALAVFKVPTIKEEFAAMAEAFRTPQILLMLLPLFVAESYLSPHSSFNSYTFTLRTRTLNNLLYWLIQIPAGYVHSRIADNTRMRRRTRALVLTTFVGVVVMAGFVGAEVVTHEAAYADRAESGPDMDWSDPGYGGRLVLYLVWGASYCLFFQLRLWFMGSLSNAPAKLARYCGLIPAFQAAGIAIAFGIDATKPAYWKEFTVWLSLFAAAFVCLYVLAFYYIEETNYFKEDTVIVPVHWAEDLGVQQALDVQTGVAKVIAPATEKC